MSTFRKTWKGISMQKGAFGRGGVRPAGCSDEFDPGGCGCCCCCACACCSCCSRAYNCD